MQDAVKHCGRQHFVAGERFVPASGREHSPRPRGFERGDDQGLPALEPEQIVGPGAGTRASFIVTVAKVMRALDSVLSLLRSSISLPGPDKSRCEVLKLLLLREQRSDTPDRHAPVDPFGFFRVHL